MKPFTKIAAIFFGVAVLVHIYRLAVHFRVVIGSHEIPLWFSMVLAVIALIFCVGLWKESKR